MNPTWALPATRLYLLFGGLLYLSIGLAGLVVPTALMELVGIIATAPSALNEVRAFFGGQSLVLGGLFLGAAFRPKWHRCAVALFVALAVAFGIARTLSLGLDGSPGTLNWVLLAMECMGVVTGAVLLVVSRPER